jgi:hypothetical protein
VAEVWCGLSCVNRLHDDFVNQHDERPSYTWTVVKIWSFIYIPWACGGSGVGTGGIGGGSGIGVLLIYVQIECLNVMVTGCLCVCGVLDVSVYQLLLQWLILEWWSVNNEFEWLWQQVVWPSLRYCVSICLKLHNGLHYRWWVSSGNNGRMNDWKIKKKHVCNIICCSFWYFLFLYLLFLYSFLKWFINFFH